LLQQPGSDEPRGACQQQPLAPQSLHFWQRGARCGDLNWNRIIPGTVRSVMRGERPVIRSDGSYIRDYFYVEDGAAAYMLLAEQMASRPELWGEAFNFSNELQITVLDLVQRVLRVMGSSLMPDVRNEASNEILHQYLSAAKARKMLGWEPLFTLEQGLEKTVAWYREFITMLDSETVIAR
jgi:CDP-glucose 4,6-dehydratase